MFKRNVTYFRSFRNYIFLSVFTLKIRQEDKRIN